MEYITPEEIAVIALLEFEGATPVATWSARSTRRCLGPTYKAGLLRGAALTILEELEKEHGVPSIALASDLPAAKHLFEAYLFDRVYGSIDKVVAARTKGAAEAVSRELFAPLEAEPLVASLAASVGIPILCPDGETLLRGPVINAPPYRKFRSTIEITPEKIDGYVKTWIDLRPTHIAWWLDTFARMQESRSRAEGAGWATARVSRATYVSIRIEIGNVVAWILGNEDEGFRML